LYFVFIENLFTSSVRIFSWWHYFRDAGALSFVQTESG